MSTEGHNHWGGIVQNPGFCPACDEQRDGLAKVLSEHRDTETVVGFGCQCRCGEPVCTPDGGQSHDWHHREHIADELLKAGWHR